MVAGRYDAAEQSNNNKSLRSIHFVARLAVCRPSRSLRVRAPIASVNKLTSLTDRQRQQQQQQQWRLL